MKPITHYLPAVVIIRGEWDERKLWIDEQYINTEHARLAFASLTALPNTLLGIAIMMHYAPVHLVAENIHHARKLGELLPREDFQQQFHLRKEFVRILKNTEYAY